MTVQAHFGSTETMWSDLGPSIDLVRKPLVRAYSPAVWNSNNIQRSSATRLGIVSQIDSRYSRFDGGLPDPCSSLNIRALEQEFQAHSTVQPLAPALRAALHDLDGAVVEAQEEGFPPPSHAAMRDARRMLLELFRLHPSRMEVYPTPEGEVALLASGGYGKSVLVLCESDGGVLCSVNLNGCHRRAWYDSSNTLPDEFVRKALDELYAQDMA